MPPSVTPCYEPLFNAPSCYSMLNSVYIFCSSAAGGSLAQAKKVDLDAVPQIKGQTIYEYDLETALEKPWRMPGMVCHSGWAQGREWWGVGEWLYGRTRGDKIVGRVHDDGRGLCVIGVCCGHVDIAC